MKKQIGFLENEDRGSRIEDRGSRIEDRGSRIKDQGSRMEDRGWRMVQATAGNTPMVSANRICWHCDMTNDDK